MVITLLFLLGATVLDSDSSALFLSADQLERTELHEDAARLFCQCADQSEVLRSYALSRAAKNYYIAGNDEAAESLFQQVVATYPEDPCIRLTWKRMGDFYFQQGRVVEARRYYNKVLAALNPLPWFLDKLAWNNADYALHLSGYEDEGYVWFRHIAATTLYRARRASAAKRLLESKNGEDRIWGIYGYVRSGKLHTAREALSKEESLVLQGAEETVSPLLTLDATLGTAQTDISGTHKRLAAILQQNQDLLWVRVWLMLAVREQAGSKHYSAAEMLAQLLSKNFPDGRDAGDVYWWFSVHYEAVPDKEAASRMYRQLVERHPEHVRAPRSLLYLANYTRDTGHAEEAFRIYDKLGHTFPGERLAAEGLYRAAELAERIGDTERQQGYLNKAAGVGPGHFYAHRACHKLRTQFAAMPGGRTLHICEEDDFLQPLSLPLKKNKGLDFLIAKDPSYQRLNFFGIHGLEEGEWEALACIIATSDPMKKIWYPAIAEAGFVHT
ncbi:MAG: hypothetical protein KAH38_01630, partial [Candidatus Hydrogenedentes bacterium]|nr:hypothetical protein [Candidatus Hydrogenedentota bacterium]